MRLNFNTTLKKHPHLDQESLTLLHGASLSPKQRLRALEEMIRFVRKFRPDLLSQPKKS